MPGFNRRHFDDLRGATRLAFDASTGITRLVGAVHGAIERTAVPFPSARNGDARGLAGLIYRGIGGGMRVLGTGIDAGLAPLRGLLSEGETSESRDAWVAVLNGVYGDHLAHTGNPLAIEMSLRHRGCAVDPRNPAVAPLSQRSDAPGTRLLLLVHGLCMNDARWQREGHDHGAALADELGYVPLYLRYNSGLRIADNGRALAGLLHELLEHWPEPVQELVIVGHSMGGLVARSAVHEAQQAGHAWPQRLGKLVFLGTPHHGAPLERGGHGLDYLLELSRYSAPFARIGRQRSAGIRDLRHGTITAGEHQHVPLPAGIRCYAAAATLGSRRGPVAERLLGDGLVPLDSALGRHAQPDRALAVPAERQWIGYQMGHLQLLSSPEVYARLRDWLSD
jgi:pimeloyl-ACP methyl ester carboxylesterase